MFVAGCASTPTESDETISSPPATTEDVSALNWSAPTPSRRFRTAGPAAAVSAPAGRAGDDVDLPHRWAAVNGISEPRQVSRAPVMAYAIKTSRGTMVLDIGSREVTWNGVEVQLGFAPQLIDDQVFVHGLDLQKNFDPLLLEPPLSFGNRVIVIDPGHGGSNVGTHSAVDGRFEKEFTLDWALRLAPLLEQEGWQVFFTRTSDVTVSNIDRVVLPRRITRTCSSACISTRRQTATRKPPAWKPIA